MKVGFLCQFHPGAADTILTERRIDACLKLGHEIEHVQHDFRSAPLPVLIMKAIPNAIRLRRCEICLVQKLLPLGLVYVLLLRLMAYKGRIVVIADDWEGVGGFASIRSRHSVAKMLLVTACEEMMPRLADRVWCVSKALYDRWEHLGKCFYLPNGG